MANLNKIKLPDGTTVDVTDGRIPSLSGNGGKVLKVNAAGTGLNWDELQGEAPLVGHFSSAFNDWVSAYIAAINSEGNPDTSALNAITCDLSVSDIKAAVENNRQVYIIGNAVVEDTLNFRFVFTPNATGTRADIDNQPFVSLTSMCAVMMNWVISMSGVQNDTDGWQFELFHQLNNSDYTKLQNIPAEAQENVIESITLNSTVQSVDENKNVTLSAVTSLRVNGTDYAPDGSGKISFSVSGGGGGAAALDVSDDNNGNLTLTVINTSNTLQVSDDNAGNIALSLV